ncbi:hypothetical protein ACOSQ2_027869 [Xanthoceras sorbifolium]
MYSNKFIFFLSPFMFRSINDHIPLQFTKENNVVIRLNVFEVLDAALEAMKLLRNEECTFVMSKLSMFYTGIKRARKNAEAYRANLFCSVLFFSYQKLNCILNTKV